MKDSQFNKVSQQYPMSYIVLTMLVITGLCAAAITAGKVVTVAGIHFPCSNIIFALLTFPMTDVISEIWGKKYAAITVWMACVAQAIFIAMVQISIVLPYPDFWTQQTAYATTLSVGPKVILANLVAFMTSQLWDVYIYCYLKQLCRGRWLWLRNNVSTFSSQMINSTFFISIVFWDSGKIIELLMGSLLLKWLIALIDTPIVYAAVHIIKHHEKTQAVPGSPTQSTLATVRS